MNSKWNFSFENDADRNMFDGKPFFCLKCERGAIDQLRCKFKGLCPLEPEAVAIKRMKNFMIGMGETKL